MKIQGNYPFSSGCPFKIVSKYIQKSNDGLLNVFLVIQTTCKPLVLKNLQNYKKLYF